MNSTPVARWAFRFIGLAVVIGAVGFVWFKKPWKKSDAEVAFSTVPVGRGAIAAQVTANGTLSARTTVQVGAQVSGRVVELKADFNDPVTKGQVLAKLDESLLRAQIDQAQAAYDLAVANERKAAVALVDADRQLKRQQGLHDQQLIAGATVESYEVTRDTARAAVAAARAQIGQARANLAQAKTNLGYATIYSPIDGVVLTRSYDVGQTVQSSFSAPTLFTIAEDLSRMQIDTSVAEGDVGRLSQGMKATFTVDAHPGVAFDGTVRQVRNSPTVNQGVVTYDAVIDVDNSERLLRPGMTANVTFVLSKVDNVTKIPNAALRFKPSRDQMVALMARFGNGRHRSGAAPTEAVNGMSVGGFGAGGAKKESSDRKPVWKLVDGKPVMAIIKLGLTDGSSTQLVEGNVAPGDQLITEIQGLPVNQRRTGAF